MSSRAYDFILQVTNPSAFYVGNSVIGSTSLSFGEVVGIDGANLKVKVANARHYFVHNESLVAYSTVNSVVNTSVSYSVTGTDSVFALPSTPKHKAEIQVYVDNVYVDSSKYVWPSTTLNEGGIDFKDVDIITFPAANDRAIANTVTFPTQDISLLEIKVKTGDIDALSFIGADTSASQIQAASSTINNVFPSNYLVHRNAFEEEPVVRLYSIYYPGEWYPADENGNPKNSLSNPIGIPWPYKFPLRYAEIIGEDFSIEDYSITHQSNNYVAFPINYPGISISSDGSVGELDLEISAIDLFLPTIVEDPNLVGYNNTSAISASVNGSFRGNIDPRTVPSSSEYDSAVADTRGETQPYDYLTTTALGEEWVSLKPDSRDLLGAVVEVRSFYASSLEFWPEYSIIQYYNGNFLKLESTAPYRVGDTVNSNVNSSTATIVAVHSNNFIELNQAPTLPFNVGHKLLIHNERYDPDAYVERVFTINKLNSYNDSSVSFNLGNRTTNLLKEVPRRKFYRNTCPWLYKGPECKYPALGVGVIEGSVPPKTANGMFTANNASTSDGNADKCSKSVAACRLRNNLVNWGGFPGVRNRL